MPVLNELSEQGFGFAVFPEVWIYNDLTDRKTIQHLIFGDYITPPKTSSGTGYQRWSAEHVVEDSEGVSWFRVRSRQTEGWIKLDDIQLTRTLEVNFVDIGQGDGCHLVTPDDEHYIIDAGERDNMYRFLRWRFNLGKPGPELPKFTALISHPDEDHWKGFEWLLSEPPTNQQRQIKFDRLYHNGILQRSGSTIGEVVHSGSHNYLRDFMIDQQSIEDVLDRDGAKSRFEQFLIGAKQHFPALQLKTAHRKDTAAASVLYNKTGLKMEVLAPVPEKIDGKWMLRWFDASKGQIGKTKNGHSIVLMLKIGKIRILLGGDLNSESADYLMEKYSGRDVGRLRVQIEKAEPAQLPALSAEMHEAVEACKPFFQADIAKSCHHGSKDITNEFLQSVNPIATVISSGDEESYFHPRPETLGAIGKYGRGDRPLIFCTELGRSSPEFLEFKLNPEAPDELKQRVVSTYGMITVRTDGQNAVVCQKLEKQRSSFGLLTKWHVEKIIWNEERQEFISKK
jgi:beta-lactamase superfamily II metal-dependent hydrolase